MHACGKGGLLTSAALSISTDAFSSSCAALSHASAARSALCKNIITFTSHVQVPQNARKAGQSFPLGCIQVRHMRWGLLTCSSGRTYSIKAVKEDANTIMVVQTSRRAAHHDPSTVIRMGACWTGMSAETATLALYVTSLTLRGSQENLPMPCH